MPSAGEGAGAGSVDGVQRDALGLGAEVSDRGLDSGGQRLHPGEEVPVGESERSQAAKMLMGTTFP